MDGVFSNLLEEADPQEAQIEGDPPGGSEADPFVDISDTVDDEQAEAESRTGDTLDGVGFTLPWPPRPVVTSAQQVEASCPATGETEGLAQSMPDIGALPYAARATGEPRVVRLVSSAADSNLSIELQPGLNMIGRQRNDNHIVLVSPDISRFHAQILVSPDAITITDKDSSNGTFVNHQRISERALDAGDVVAFSDEFSFQVLIDLPLSCPETLTLSEGRETDKDTQPQQGWTEEPDEASPVPADRSLETWDSTMDSAPEPAEPPPFEPPPAEPSPFEQPAPETPPPPAEPAPEPPPAERPPRTATTPGRESPHMERPPEPEPDLLPEPEPRPAPYTPSMPLAESRATGPELDLLSEEGAPLGPEEIPEPEPPTGLVDEDTHLSNPVSLALRHPSEVALTIPSSQEVVILERERRQLAVLYQVSKRCMMAGSLEELDRLLINVLERMVAFHRAFITYRLQGGDWKLVMSKHKYQWQKEQIRHLLHLSRRSRESILVQNSREEPGLGASEDGLPDTRLLLPLWTQDVNVGAVFLVSQVPNSFDSNALNFLELFAEIAALALHNGTRLEP